ncbi:MAG: hypothetical protein IIB00_02465 [candidate division Zixibacteria bacterium]|nr:hypothetical protein [candidate division Zixibacteria bacterium]
MRFSKFTLIVALMSFVTVSCGSDSVIDPVVIPEVGSNSLLVIADVDGIDIAPGVFTTSFNVDVTDSLGADVIDAVVTITHSALGVVTLPMDALNPGTYVALTNNYFAGTYWLSVRRGTDSLINGRVFGPDIHTIVYPTTSDTLFTDGPFTVLWTRIYSTEEVEIETRDFQTTLSTSTTSPDTGSYTVSSGGTVRNDQRIRVSRANTTVLTTGWTGSNFEASIRNTNEPIVVQ